MPCTSSVGGSKSAQVPDTQNSQEAKGLAISRTNIGPHGSQNGRAQFGFARLGLKLSSSKALF